MEPEFIEGLPLEETMIFEEEHAIQLNTDQKQELKNAGAIFLYLRDKKTKELIGETYYIPVDNMKKLSKDLQAEGVEGFYGQNAVYCYSNTTLKLYQRKGYARELKKYFLEQAKGKGYGFVLGHALQNGSDALNFSFGAVEIRRFEKWAGTEETAVFYRQQL
jgi:GNAT superfamily N-acetyltransferase